MAVRSNIPTQPALNATVSAGVPVNTITSIMGFAAFPQVGYIVQVGAGLTATFSVMVSIDNKTFVDSGQVLPSVSGSALNFPVQYSGVFPFVRLLVSPSAGSGTVLVQVCTKGMA
jgi:hypothetical protein